MRQIIKDDLYANVWPERFQCHQEDKDHQLTSRAQMTGEVSSCELPHTRRALKPTDSHLEFDGCKPIINLNFEL